MVMRWVAVVVVTAYVLQEWELQEESRETGVELMTREYLCTGSTEDCAVKVSVSAALTEELFPQMCTYWKPALVFLVSSIGYKAISETMKEVREVINSRDSAAAITAVRSVCDRLGSTLCEQLQHALSLPCF